MEEKKTNKIPTPFVFPSFKARGGFRQKSAVLISLFGEKKEGVAFFADFEEKKDIILVPQKIW